MKYVLLVVLALGLTACGDSEPSLEDQRRNVEVLIHYKKLEIREAKNAMVAGAYDATNNPAFDEEERDFMRGLSKDIYAETVRLAQDEIRRLEATLKELKRTD